MGLLTSELPVYPDRGAQDPGAGGKPLKAALEAKSRDSVTGASELKASGMNYGNLAQDGVDEFRRIMVGSWWEEASAAGHSYAALHPDENNVVPVAGDEACRRQFSVHTARHPRACRIVPALPTRNPRHTIIPCAGRPRRMCALLVCYRGPTKATPAVGILLKPAENVYSDHGILDKNYMGVSARRFRRAWRPANILRAFPINILTDPDQNRRPPLLCGPESEVPPLRLLSNIPEGLYNSHFFWVPPSGDATCPICAILWDFFRHFHQIGHSGLCPLNLLVKLIWL
ncbi:hypothetical protein B0H17DRAFT_1152761 [Mycena rosella]|uniref:Uncharacterized protein n=1 Tax=Mycena rosella TaxID=1033263 RepID=A0AAD7BAL8_MYCRO|nr:hypothetical protein B0H17DRAFT_1152761 [Mycena rosella]